VTAAPARRGVRRAAWLGMGLVVVVALAVGTRQPGDPPTELERVEHLTAQLRCPTCRGLSVAESDAPASQFIEAETRRRVSLGQSDEAILAYFADRYGAEAILLSPPRDGVGLVVWALPVAAAIVAVAGLTLALRRWRRAAPPPLSEEDRRLVAQALAAEAAPAGGDGAGGR